MMYHQMPTPPRSEHLWRYTPWSRIQPLKNGEVPEAAGIVFTSSHFAFTENPLGDVEHSDIARAFILACKGASVSITIEESSEPIHIHASSNDGMAVGNLHLELKGSATVFVHLNGESDWCGLHLTANVHPNVHIGFGFINDLGASSNLLRCEDWQIERNASVEHATLSIGGLRCKSDVRSNLNAPGSSVRKSVTVSADKKSHEDQHVEIHHLHPHTDSDLVMNSACNDRSHFVGTGLLTIARNAHHSHAGQVFRNLLLSDKARAEAIPELEVLADDVSAAHGAASAPVDETQMHYLMSRGLNHEQSQSLIVSGFLLSAFSNLKNQQLAEEMQNQLNIHLEDELVG
jgi:Fe-S cluster assembly protein SufD